MNNIEQQLELEKRMTQLSIDKFKIEFQKNQQANNFGNTKTANTIIGLVLNDFTNAINDYLIHYGKGNAVKSTMAGAILKKVGADKAAYIAAKVILNTIYGATSVQSVYRSIGQALEDEFKMNMFSQQNKNYYRSIQDDLNKRQAKAQRKKYITSNMFQKRLNFHLDCWSITEKVQTGIVLVELFINSTQLVEFKIDFKGKKQIRYLAPTVRLKDSIDNINEKLEVLEPFFLPMVCKPQPWRDVFIGGYLSPYLKRNKFIKNNNKEYLKSLRTWGLDNVYKAVNLMQATPWMINKKVLDVMSTLWQQGQAIAGLPCREDLPVTPFPFPELTPDDTPTQEQTDIIKNWKREVYETHKTNVATRSHRILISQILRIATQFKDYEKIYFPYQLDFRGRMYPIPVLLHPQGSDIAKGLLTFARGKPLCTEEARKWFLIHGANMFGVDKVSYQERIKWVEEHSTELLNYGTNPYENTGWEQADKPFQFLAWCFEYVEYYKNNNFVSCLAIQLDGTCNGLQHYSALLRDEEGGKAVNLIPSSKPNDIYQIVADKLVSKLTEIRDNNTGDIHKLANAFLTLGINRKLTKRPVMILPYGGTRLACRAYIMDYLKENYSNEYLWNMFEVGETPQDCLYKISSWLSPYLWEAITNTVTSAIIGMDYLKGVARETLKHQNYLEWFTPMGLLVHQAYSKSRKKEIRTELFGKVIKTNFMLEAGQNIIDKQHQLNGICPNFIHSLDASCLMSWILKCEKAGITNFMSVHDCYGTLAADTEKSAQLLREAFVEIYQRPVLDDFEADMQKDITEELQFPSQPVKGNLEITDVLNSDYFFN